MAMLKFAAARVVRPAVSKTEWANIRRDGTTFTRTAALSVKDNLAERAAEMFQTPFDPSKYLLTHATIIASVDTYAPSGLKAGSVLEDGFRVNRRFPSFRVVPSTAKYINNNCLIPGTPITMADGTVKPIEEIQVGDLVLTHLGRARRVTETFTHDVDGLILRIKIRGTDECLYVTGEHPFFVFRPNQACVECGGPIKRKVQAVSHLLGKHYCSKECYYKKRVSNSTLLRDKTGEFLPASSLGYGDFAATPVIEGDSPVPLTLGQARLIGLFLAEGSYELDSRNENARVGVVWAFHQKERSTLAQMVCDLMQSEFGADCVVRDVSGCQGIIVSTRTNRQAAEFFGQWVYGDRAQTKTLNPLLIRAPKDIQTEILRGWLDGDGSGFDTHMDGGGAGDYRVVGSTASQSLASQMRLIFHRLGIAPRWGHSESPGRKRLVVEGAVRIVSDPTKTCHAWHLSSGACWVSELVETTRFEESYADASQARGAFQEAPALRFLNGYVLQMVTDVTPVDYIGKVHNFETEEDHSYIAGGIAVHNSDFWPRGVLAKAYPTFIGGHNFCFAPGTLVRMGDGTTKAIEAVQVGDLVLTHTGQTHRVLRVFERPFEGILQGLLFDRYKEPLFATEEHPFRGLVAEASPSTTRQGTSPENAGRYGRSKIAQAIRQGAATEAWLPAGSLSEGTYVCGAGVENPEGFSGGTEDQSVILGYYLAEGCQLVPTQTAEDSRGVVITPGVHEMAVVEDLRVRVGRVFPGTRISVTPTQSSTYRVELRGAEIGAWLFEHGNQHAATKCLASSVLTWGKESLRWLLASWLNGDGNLMPNSQRLRGFTVSQSLAYQMLRIADIVGVKSSLTRTPKEKIRDSLTTLTVAGEPRDFVVHPNYDLWTLTVSRDSAEMLGGRSVRRSTASVPPGGKRSDLAWFESKRIHRVAKRIDYPYSGAVYNLEVEGDNSYVVGCGIAVHNCEHVQIEELSKGRIIDAVARDIGDALYVDILIATDRRHEDLVKAIQSGKMGTLSMGCFLPGTQVSLADGRRIAIEDVQPGDFVLTHKGRSREVLNKQIRGGVFGIQQIRAVGISSTITATDNHPFYVFRQPDICACGCGEALPVCKRKDAPRGMARRFLRGHDKRVFNPNATYSLEEAQERRARLASLTAWEMQKIRADELRVGDFLCFPRMLDTVEAGVSNGRARLLGYFLAEGSFLKRKGVPCETQFCFSRDEKDTLVAEVISLLKQEFDLANDPWVQERFDRNTCTVHVSGKDVAAWFKAHGGEYGSRKRLSVEVMGWSVENHKHLLGAWLDGDGHLARINGNTSGTTTSYDLACQMHLLLARCGIFARLECRIGARAAGVCEAMSSGFARDPVSGRLPAFNLVVGNLQSQGLVGYTAKCCPSSTFEVQRARVRDDVVMFPIKSIQAKSYEGWVHNMEVDEDHTYVVEGVTVGNCTIDGSQCTKCGHWAADETEMCSHIRYMKGNTFFDEQGVSHKIAEKCGDDSLDPTGGVTFIEASWVETPAFTGAVLRNVLEPTEAQAKQAAEILAMPPKQWSADAVMKAASVSPMVIQKKFAAPVKVALTDDAFFAGWMDEGDAGTPEEGTPAEDAAKPPAEASPVDDMVKRLEDYATKEVEKRIRERIQQKNTPAAPGPEESSSLNETIMKQAAGRVYTAALDTLIRTASSDIALVNAVAEFNAQAGIHIPVGVYRAALKVGPTSAYTNVEDFRSACDKALGRRASLPEAKTLVRIGKLLSRRRASEQQFISGSRQGGSQ